MSKLLESFNAIINDLKDDLGEGFVASDIWHSRDAQSLAGYNSQPKAVALFNEVTRTLSKTLAGAGYPGLGDYYMVHLESGLLVVITKAGDYQLGMLVDLSKTTMGMLMSIVLPKLIENLNEAAANT